jgi:hypothetical protein
MTGGAGVHQSTPCLKIRVPVSLLFVLCKMDSTFCAVVRAWAAISGALGLLLVARVGLGLGWLALLGPTALASGGGGGGGVWYTPSGSWSGSIGEKGRFLHLLVGGEYLPGGNHWNIHRHSGIEGRDGRVSVGMTTAGRWKRRFGGCALGLGGAGRKVADLY